LPINCPERNDDLVLLTCASEMFIAIPLPAIMPAPIGLLVSSTRAIQVVTAVITAQGESPQ